MKRVITAALLAASMTLGACGSEDEGPQPRGDERIVGKDWQVVAIYTKPDEPSAIPQTAKAVPQMSFGESSIVGSTGCAPFQAKVSYSEAEDTANIRDADTMHIDKVRMDTRPDDCTGSALWADNLLRNLLAEDHDFEVRLNPNNQLVLTLDTAEVDSPAIRMVSL
ncbi:hypothetical protein [Corynebacterium sp. c25Ua_89]|uniref:hypothetical protein n=1 Tax=Corynebacterium sp. c25Ua_89 TaxID=3032356 RepID=UPI0039C4E3EA